MSHSNPIDVIHVIDHSPFSYFQVRVIVLCAIVAMLDGFDTQSIGYVAPAIAAQWSVSLSTFGLVFGAGLLGLTFGALIFGPVADRYGRRRVILLSTLLFAVFALLTVTATSMPQLVLLRLFTGIGLGGAMPNLIALTSEYSPRHLRATMVTVMFAGFPLGSMLGGFVSAEMIPVWGWHSVFYLGGALPVLMLPLLWLFLPESIRFLTARTQQQHRVAEILRRLAPAMQLSASSRYFLSEATRPGNAIGQLFSEQQGRMTLLLWLAFFMNLLVMYFLVSWLPSLLQTAGLSSKTAIWGTAILNGGGVIGSLIISRLVDRFNPFKVLAIAYAGAALSIYMTSIATVSPGFLLISVFFAGFGVVGAQLGINAVVANVYPTAIRSTGVGWALGIGRVGSILGPVLGGLLIAAGWEGHSIVMLCALPALIAAATVGVLGSSRVQVPVSAAETIETELPSEGKS